MNARTIINRLARPGALACLALLIGLTAATARAASAPAPSASLDIAASDTYVSAQMRALRIPGLTLGIVQGDRIIHLKGFGVTGADGRAVTPQTPFRISSLGKPITAVAIMQMVEAGKLDLDAPVEQQAWLMASVYVVVALIIAIVAGPRFGRKPTAPAATRPGRETGQPIEAAPLEHPSATNTIALEVVCSAGR